MLDVEICAKPKRRFRSFSIDGGQATAMDHAGRQCHAERVQNVLKTILMGITGVYLTGVMGFGGIYILGNGLDFVQAITYAAKWPAYVGLLLT